MYRIVPPGCGLSALLFMEQRPFKLGSKKSWEPSTAPLIRRNSMDRRTSIIKTAATPGEDYSSISAHTSLQNCQTVMHFVKTNVEKLQQSVEG